MALALGTLPLLLIEVDRSELHSADQRLLDIANIVVLVAFAIDYIVELVLADDRRSHVRREWTSALIVVTQALAVVPSLAAFGILRALRAARLIRIVVVVGRAVAVGGSAAREGRAVLLQNSGRLALSVAGLTWLSSGAVFLVAENTGELSVADALWWSATTMTTVGYGDISPVTPAGRLIGGLAMLLGISVFSLVTAKVAEVSAPPRAAHRTR